MDRGQHGAEDFLSQVGGVGVLQPLLARVAVHQRLVQVDELPPRADILRIPEAHNEAGARGGDVGHWPSE
jgi:hypothetical protein